MNKKIYGKIHKKIREGLHLDVMTMSKGIGFSQNVVYEKERGAKGTRLSYHEKLIPYLQKKITYSNESTLKYQLKSSYDILFGDYDDNKTKKIFNDYFCDNDLEPLIKLLLDTAYSMKDTEEEIKLDMFMLQKVKYTNFFLRENCYPIRKVKNFIEKCTVSELRRSILKKEVFTGLKEIELTGVFYPGILLFPGWWDEEEEENNFLWKDGIQEWFFAGFNTWGPSWDISWSLDEEKYKIDQKYFYAQLGSTDESDSFLVIIPQSKAKETREYLKKGGGWECGNLSTATGLFGHKKYFKKELSNLDFIKKHDTSFDYCLKITDLPQHGIKPASKYKKSNIYSAYLWKCLIPEKIYLESKPIKLKDVYFAWEHSNLANNESVKYGLEALDFKQHLLEKKHGKFIMLQKSSHFVEGQSAMDIRKFQNLLDLGI